MGNFYYFVLRGRAVSSITTTHNANYDLLSNIQAEIYWSATERVGTSTAWGWAFNFYGGSQGYDFKSTKYFNAWAVHSGDVSAVPVPSAFYLFGSGLIGLIGIAKRKKA